MAPIKTDLYHRKGRSILGFLLLFKKIRIFVVDEKGFSEIGIFFNGTFSAVFHYVFYRR